MTMVMPQSAASVMKVGSATVFPSGFSYRQDRGV
jgi:hypothetical protein